jgi:NtrC-family two-component system sensor histidine kinase KinB
MIKSIRAKIVWTFAGLVVLNLMAGFWSIYNFYALGSTVAKILRENYQSVLAADNMVKALDRLDNSLLTQSEEEYVTAGGDILGNRDLFVYWQKEAARSIALPTEEHLRDSIQANWILYAVGADSTMALIQQGAFQESKQYYYVNVRPTSDRLRELCFRLFEVNQAAIINAGERTQSIASQTAFATMLALIVTLIFSIVATAWMIRGIITPAEQLTDRVRQIGAGMLDLKIDVLSDDEIGQLSREFNKMTERLKRFEQMNIDEILSEKRKSDTIVQSIADGLIMTDAALRVLHLNRVVGELYRVDEAGSIGKPLASVIHDDRIVSLLAVSVPAAGPAEHTPGLLQYARGEKTFYYRPKVTRILDAEGALYGVLLLLQDVTQFKELDRMKSDFIATLSHEFRTPVTSIGMTVDILNQEILGKLNEKQRELIASAKEDCVRLTKLARELLQLSKLESGRIQLRNEELNVRALIESSLRPLQLPFADKGVELGVDVQDGLPALVADEQQVTWVITNLVTNALKYTGPQGSVTVRAREDHGCLLVEVEDTGVGIAPEHLQTIFDKFVQVKRGTDATPGSVGLGLAIAKEIVELYGGRIWASSAPGQGSTFSFELPFTTATVGQSSEGHT